MRNNYVRNPKKKLLMKYLRWLIYKTKCYYSHPITYQFHLVKVLKKHEMNEKLAHIMSCYIL